MSYWVKSMQRTWLILAFLMLIAILIPMASGQQTPDGWVAKGKILFDQGKYDDAIMAYENATELITENTTDVLASAWYELGNAFLDRGMNDDASRCYENAISLDPAEFYWCNYGYSTKMGGYIETWQGVSMLCKGGIDNYRNWLNETNPLR